MSVDRENRGSCKSKHKVALELAGYLLAHIAKLWAMTLVEDKYYIIFCQYLLQLLVAVEFRFHQVREFLYGGNDYVDIIILQLSQKYLRWAVTISAILLKIIILLHCLVIQVFAVYNEDYLLYTFHPWSKLSCLERCERFTRTSGMPDISTRLDCALPTHIHCSLYALQNFLGSGNLIRTHYQQLLIYIKHAVLG